MPEPISPKRKKANKIILIIFGVFAFFFFYALIKDDRTPEQKAAQAEADSLAARADSVQTMLYGLHYIAKKKITDNLKDPDSFEEIEHKEYEVIDKTPLLYYQAKIKYRAKNSFGGFVIETKCFNFLESGTLTEVFDCE